MRLAESRACVLKRQHPFGPTVDGIDPSLWDRDRRSSRPQNVGTLAAATALTDTAELATKSVNDGVYGYAPATVHDGRSFARADSGRTFRRYRLRRGAILKHENSGHANTRSPGRAT
jgi:hypothetical protein